MYIVPPSRNRLSCTVIQYESCSALLPVVCPLTPAPPSADGVVGCLTEDGVFGVRGCGVLRDGGRCCATPLVACVDEPNGEGGRSRFSDEGAASNC